MREPWSRVLPAVVKKPDVGCTREWSRAFNEKKNKTKIPSVCRRGARRPYRGVSKAAAAAAEAFRAGSLSRRIRRCAHMTRPPVSRRPSRDRHAGPLCQRRRSDRNGVIDEPGRRDDHDVGGDIETAVTTSFRYRCSRRKPF